MLTSFKNIYYDKHVETREKRSRKIDKKFIICIHSFAIERESELNAATHSEQMRERESAIHILCLIMIQERKYRRRKKKHNGTISDYANNNKKRNQN